MRKYATGAETAWHHKLSRAETMAIASLRELFTGASLALIKGRIYCLHLRATRRLYSYQAVPRDRFADLGLKCTQKGGVQTFDLQLKTKAGAHFFTLCFESPPILSLRELLSIQKQDSLVTPTPKQPASNARKVNHKYP